MKKVFLMFAAAMLTASVSAQNTTITANKAGDNWYVGIKGGAATPMVKWDNAAESDGAGFFKGFAPNAGIRIGKNLTTVFGLALDGTVYFESNDKSGMKTKTFVDAMAVDLLGTINLMNAFAGYKGEPRAFEIFAIAGMGYNRYFGKGKDANGDAIKESGINFKGGLDLAFNLGKDKAWQLYLEPAVVFGLPQGTWGDPFTKMAVTSNGKATEKLNGLFQLNLGLNYKFGTSNGTHNYAKAQLRDQAEIDGLNNQINSLRNEVASKNNKIAADDKTINDLKSQLNACKNRPMPTAAAATVVKSEPATLQPIVIFGQGKTNVDAAGMASCEMVAKYMKNHKDAKVQILGYASPEGSKEVNDRIAKARAEAVKNVLVKKYKIAADRLEAKGEGATDKLSSENDFNRVAKFIDVTKK